MNHEALQKALKPLLWPLSRVYARIMQQRRKQCIAVHGYRTHHTCVSVGNIAVGGTGKTPVIGWLLDWAEEHDLKAAVLSRGYGGSHSKKTRAWPLVVNNATPASLCGDEPLTLARNHPDAVVFVHARRSRSAHAAEDAHSPNVIFLDDGMQHLAVKRDADLVLFRQKDFGDDWDQALPCGLWREGKEALQSAAAFLVKASAEEFALLTPLAEQRLAPLGKPLFSFILSPIACERLNAPAENAPAPPEAVPPSTAPTPSLKGKKRRKPQPVPEELLHSPYVFFSGLGNPQQAEKTATEYLGRPPEAHFSFTDHHAFTAADVAKIAQSKLPVLCTQKDAVKIEPILAHFGSVPVYVLLARVRFGPALFTKESFPEWWEGWWRDNRR